MTTNVTLRADCARCAALCCVALAFDRSDLFAIDKAAGDVCPHLSACGACAIHAERTERGFGGCVGYDCLGAGQRVVQDLFAGASWMESPSLMAPMVRAFATVRRAHALLELLEAAKGLPLSSAEGRALASLERALQAVAAQARTAPWDEQVAARVHRFLRALAPRVSALAAE